MTDKTDYPPENAGQPADEVLAEFIRRRDAGEQVDVESLCAARPDLADALRSYADGEAMFREMAADDSVSGANALAETVRPGAGRDTDASMTGRSFGNYRIVRQLGQGGMGAVYLAEDTTLQRHVALKIPRFTAADGPDARERFFREARSAAALTHPHICPVFHADEMNGTPFIAMAFVDGQPLSRFVGTPEFRDQRCVAELIRLVADALQHAHDQGFIHRDLKPGNIMLDRDGKPVVTDFGLARRLVPNQESRITQEGQLVGTPAYMSPEQIAGKSGKISSSTDVYALGVVLFELLASRLPFQGSVPEVIAGALKSEPPKVSSIRSDVSSELETLCLQMLRKEPEQRPKSMRDVADRLQRWLEKSSPASAARQEAAQKLKDELIAEREHIEKLTRAGKFEAAVKRLQVLARRKEPAANEFREWAIDQIPRVKARPAQSKRNEPKMLQMAQEWMTKHDYQQAIQILRSIPDLCRSEACEELLQEATELQEEADDLLLDLKKCVKDRIYDGIDDNLNRLLVLKPGNQFAKNLQQKLQGYRSGRGKGRPYHFDKQGRLLAINEDNFWSRAMILSAVVGLVVFGLMTWAITIYLKSGDRTVAVEIDPAWLQEHGANLTLSVDGDEHTLSSPELDLKISVGEHGFAVRDNGRLIHNPQTFTIEQEGRQVLRIDASGVLLSTLSDSLPTQLAGDTPAAAPEFELQQLLSYDFIELAGQDLYVRGLVVPGPGAKAYLSIGNLIYRFPEDATQSPVQLSEHGEGGAYDIEITSDRQHIAIARAHGRVEIWSTEPWEMKHRLAFTDISGNATMVEISPDGRWVGAVMMRGRAAVWELESGRLVTEIPIESDEPWTLRPAFSTDSQKMIVVGQNGKGRKIYEIDVESGESDIKLCDAVSGHGDIVIGSHGRAVIASHPNGPLYLVNSSTWQDARIIGSCGDEKALAWSPDSMLLASANSKDQGLALYDGTNCKWLKNIALDGLDIEDVAFSRDSQTLAVSGLVTRSDVEGPVPAIRVWRLSEKSEGGQSPPYLTGIPRTPIPDGPPGLVKTFDLGEGGVGTVSVSPDGRLMAAGGSGRKLQVWDIETDKLLWSGQLGSYPALIGHCLFIRNGTQILAAGSSGCLEKFDARNGTMLLRYEGHSQKNPPSKAGSTIATLDQLPNGSGFVTISRNGTFAVWDFDSSQPKQYIDLSKECWDVHAGLSDDGIVVSRLKDSKDEIRLLSTQTGETIRTYGGTRFPNVAAVHSNSNSFLRYEWGNPDLEFVDVTTGNVERSYKTPKGHVLSSRYTPNGRYAIVATSEPAIRIWEIASGNEIVAYPQTRRSSTLSCSPDGRFLFFGDNFEDDNGATDAQVNVWRLPQACWAHKTSDASTVK